VVGVLDGANGVHGDVEGAVGAVLETDGERQTGGQLTVDLGLGGTGTDCAEGQTIGKELGGDRVQHFTSDGHALVGQVDEELAGDAQTLVDVEAVVEIRVVDQTLPADCCTGLLKVRAHDNEQVILVLLLQLQQPITVLEGHLRVVDRAGADDHHQALLLGVGAVDNRDGLITALQHRLPRLLGQCDLMLEEVGRGEGVVADNCVPTCELICIKCKGNGSH